MKKSFTLTITQEEDGLIKAAMEYNPPLQTGDTDDARMYFAQIAFDAVQTEMKRLEPLGDWDIMYRRQEDATAAEDIAEQAKAERDCLAERCGWLMANELARDGIAPNETCETAYWVSLARESVRGGERNE